MICFVKQKEKIGLVVNYVLTFVFLVKQIFAWILRKFTYDIIRIDFVSITQVVAL